MLNADYIDYSIERFDTYRETDKIVAEIEVVNE